MSRRRRRRDPATDAFLREVGFRVAAKRCHECLFSDGRVVSSRRARSIVRECQANGRYFLCHLATDRGEAVVCRGFFDKVPNLSCGAALQLGLVALVNPGTGELVTPAPLFAENG